MDKFHLSWSHDESNVTFVCCLVKQTNKQKKTHKKNPKPEVKTILQILSVVGFVSVSTDS